MQRLLRLPQRSATPSRARGAHRAPARAPARALALAHALAALLITGADTAKAQGARLPPQLEFRIPKPPTVLTADGARVLVYELHLTNFGGAPVTLRRLDVMTEGDARTLITLQDTALARTLARPGVTPAPPLMTRATLGGGLRAVAFLWVPLSGATPTRIWHRAILSRTTGGDTVVTDTLDRASTGVSSAVAIVGPPLRGGPWLAANGPDAMAGHRRALIAAADAPTIAQRFAIDYVKVDTAYRTHAGDAAKNESYYAEGLDALAVADGKVVAIKDGIPENVPGIDSRAVPITLETVGGNHVIIDIGGGHYAFYAHLRPGSLKVKLGDRVKRGQVVGLVGNSGNSTEPHLHFHISDSPSPLGSEGVPYQHDRFELLGRCAPTFSGCKVGAAQQRVHEMPLGFQLVQFPK
ncbi:MAG: M23 family metallopeptidase [Gemmatimonadaceae bacterium]|nr:M23 family metallopeptidase [Gemmatimonadaceae bacterium]